MTDQWLELNGEIYAVLVRKAKKMPRYNPAKMYQGNAKLANAIGKLLRIAQNGEAFRNVQTR